MADKTVVHSGLVGRGASSAFMRSDRHGGFVLLMWLAAVLPLEQADAARLHHPKHSPVIEAVARKHGIDPLLIHAVVKVESNFNPKAVSHAGARGLMQLMPITQRELGVVDVFDPRENVDGGTRYLIGLIKRYNSVRKALWAYNAGPTRVDTKGPPGESRRYADRVLRIFWTTQASAS